MQPSPRRRHRRALLEDLLAAVSALASEEPGARRAAADILRRAVEREAGAGNTAPSVGVPESVAAAPADAHQARHPQISETVNASSHPATGRGVDSDGGRHADVAETRVVTSGGGPHGSGLVPHPASPAGRLMPRMRRGVMPERARVAAEALGAGKSMVETCSLAGIHHVTLSRWQKHPLFVEYLSSIRTAQIRAIEVRARELAPVALAALQDVAVNGKDGSKIEAARTLLRVAGAAGQPNSGSEPAAAKPAAAVQVNVGGSGARSPGFYSDSLPAADRVDILTSQSG